MTDTDKAIEVLQRTGQPRRWVEAFSDDELAELSAIHDEADDDTLAGLVKGFWARRAAQLDALKAVDEGPRHDDVGESADRLASSSERTPTALRLNG